METQRKCHRKQGKSNFQEGGNVSWHQIIWGALAEHKAVIGLDPGMTLVSVECQDRSSVMPGTIIYESWPRLDPNLFPKGTGVGIADCFTEI